VYTPDGSRALIGAIGTIKHSDNTVTTKNTDNSKNSEKIEKVDVEVDGLGLKERAKGSSMNNRNTTGMVSPSSNKDYIVDEFTENEGSARGVNFEVYKGDRVLISGPSGTGKSSLLRAISGLWEMGDGRIAWKSSINQTYAKVNQHCQSIYTKNARAKNNSNSDSGIGNGSGSGGGVGGGTEVRAGVGAVGGRAPSDVFFLPQKPYNLLGTLRQQIAYPGCYPEYGTGEETDGSGEGVAVRGDVVRGMKGREERVGMIGSEKVGDNDRVVEGEEEDEDKKDEDDEVMNERNNMRMNRDETQAQGQQHTQSHTVKSKNVFGKVTKQDEKLLYVLKKVHLDTLASRMGGGDESEGLGIEKDWSKVCRGTFLCDCFTHGQN
jgi:energy-coupling factor transporter ATP-binding protein EcfA2